MSPTYGYVTKLFLESEFQHKGNKQTKKRKFSAKSCSFLGRNRFRKYKYLNTTKKRIKKYLDKIVIIRTGTIFKLLPQNNGMMPPYITRRYLYNY